MRILWDARLELHDAIRVYNEQLPGRGDRFVARVESTLRRILDAPLSFPRVYGIRPVMRKAKVQGFPYTIYFYMDHGKPSQPVVLAVAHGKRAPLYWRKRLGV